MVAPFRYEAEQSGRGETGSPITWKPRFTKDTEGQMKFACTTPLGGCNHLAVAFGVVFQVITLVAIV